MKRSLILVLLFISSSCLAQNKKALTYKTHPEYVDQWDSIMLAYKDTLELVIPIADRLIKKATSKLDSIQIIQATKYQGLSHRKMGNYVQSVAIFKEVYKYAKEHKDSILQAESADQIGIMYTFMGNMKEAQAYVLETAEIYNQVGSLVDKANSNNGLAIFYHDIGQTNKAVKIYNLALRQYESIDDTMGRANIYGNLGYLYLEEKKYELAEENILMQGHLDTLMNSQWGLGFFHDFMGSLRRRQGRYTQALKWKKSSLKIREKLDSHYNIADTRSGLANVYLALGQYDNAIINANHILDHKEEHQSLSQQMGAYGFLSSAYEKLGNSIKSLAYYKQYKLMSDSIYNRDLISEMETKDALYEKAKQDREIAELNAINEIADNEISSKNRTITVGVIALGIISILILFLSKLLQRYKSKKDKLAKILGEKDILLKEIHHRVKNNLQIISSLLTLQGRSIDNEMAIQAINEGKNRVRSMALIHQDLYNRENLTSIGMKSYMEKLIQELFDTYRIDQARVSLVFDIQDLELDIDTVIPLGLIINELVTNCLKYAFPNQAKGILDVSLKESNEEMILVVSDDGIGYNPKNIRKGSFGSTLINALTEQLDGTLQVINEKGTSIIISIRDYKTNSNM